MAILVKLCNFGIMNDNTISITKIEIKRINEFLFCIYNVFRYFNNPDIIDLCINSFSVL
jgi:hypothetical protein